MNHDDFAFEPVRGLPAALPPGESLLWQGSPVWWALALRAYHVRKVALYFLALVLFRVAFGMTHGQEWRAILESGAFILVLGLVAIGVMSLLAYLTARSTVYSMTSRRVLLRHGVAVPMTMNIPLRLIESAALRTFADGTGEIVLTVARNQRVGYLITWPHLRPGHITRPEPAFKALADWRHAADILASALAAEAGTSAVRIDVEPAAPAAEPVPAHAVAQGGAHAAAHAATRRHTAAA